MILKSIHFRIKKMKMMNKMIFLQNHNRTIHPIPRQCFIKLKGLLIANKTQRLLTYQNLKDQPVSSIKMIRSKRSLITSKNLLNLARCHRYKINYPLYQVIVYLNKIEGILLKGNDPHIKETLELK